MVTYDLFGMHFVDPERETAGAVHQGDGQHRLGKWLVTIGHARWQCLYHTYGGGQDGGREPSLLPDSLRPIG